MSVLSVKGVISGSFLHAKEPPGNFHLTDTNQTLLLHTQPSTHLQLPWHLILLLLFDILKFIHASQFPWQQRWNCWTCIVKANTAMGLLKTRGVERRSPALTAAATLVVCTGGRGWVRERRERERREEGESWGGGQCSCWGDRECLLVASADNSTSARVLLSGEQSTGGAEDWAAERRMVH